MGSAIQTFSNQSLQPAMYPETARTVAVAIKASQNIARGTVLGEVGNVSSVQTITITGGPTGGTFTLTFNGQTTAAIAYNASAATVQAALVALSSIGAGNVVVAGAGGGPWTVTFQNALGGQPLVAITGNGAGLTGGAGPAVAVVQTTAGVAPTNTFAAYNAANTDGTQVARGLAKYDMQTDAQGNITLSATAGQSGGPLGETYLIAAIYMTGYFSTTDLIGLDAGAVTSLGKLTEGSIASGMLRVD